MSSTTSTAAVESAIATRVLARPWRILVWAAMAGWSGALFAIARSHFLEFRLQRFDLGNVVQAVWSTAHGRPLEVTFGTGEQAVRLGSHVDPILALLAPVWLVAPTPLTLAAIQIGACALGALPVFWLGRRHLGSERGAALLALAYLAYPWLAWTALDAMHPVTLAIPLFLFAIWFLDSDRLVPFAVCTLLAAATGELMGLPVAVLGLWFWQAHGRRRAGLWIAAAGLLWSVASVKLIVPAFSGSESNFYAYYAAIGGSPEGVIGTLFTRPGAILDALFARADLVYWFALAAPLGGVFLLAPALAAAALPQLAANGLTSLEGLTDPRGHHVGAVIPFLVAATVLGLARLAHARRDLAAVTVLALSVSSSLAFSPWPGVPGPRVSWLHPWSHGTPSAQHIDALRQAVAIVPASARVAATNKVGSHLSARRYVYSVPLVANAEWVVVDLEDPWVPLTSRERVRTMWGRDDPQLLVSLTRRLERSPDWEKVLERSRVFVFRRAVR